MMASGTKRKGERRRGGRRLQIARKDQAREISRMIGCMVQVQVRVQVLRAM
jgi:hypothetical protein